MQAAWWGVILIVIIIIAVVITIVVLNRGNNVNIIESLPSYRIFYPSANTFWGLFNVAKATPTNGFFVTGDSVWTPVVNTSVNPDLDQWSLVSPTGTSFIPSLAPNEKLFLLANTIYSQIGVRYFPSSPNNPQPPLPSQIGYINADLAPIIGMTRKLRPFASPTDALIFIYTDLGDNLFTLRSSTSNFFVSVDANNYPIYVSDTNVFKIATFQLVPIKK